MKIFLFAMLLTFALASNERVLTTDNLMCEIAGTCVSCHDSEMESESCKETGRRIRIRCKDAESEFDDYKSCMRTSEDEQLRVVLFQVIMAVVGGLAYWGVQVRKKNVMSLFDHRRSRRQQV